MSQTLYVFTRESVNENYLGYDAKCVLAFNVVAILQYSVDRPTGN
jgi:hypothetical protein